MNRLSRTFRLSSLLFVIALVAALGSPVFAQGPRPPKSSPPPVSEEEEELRDLDHDRLLDNLDRRVDQAQDDDPLPVILLFNRPLSEIDFEALREELGDFDVKFTYPTINGAALTLKVRQIRAAARLGQVQQLEYDAAARVTLNTATNWYGVNKARTDFGVTGDTDGPAYGKNDIVIAVIDTGIDIRHVDLDGGKVICWRDEVNGRTTPYDDHGHGTHVASIAAGEGQGNAAYKGVASGAALVGIKVLNAAGSGTISQVLNGIQWAINNRVACGIKVINLSLGIAGSSDGTDATSQMVNAAVTAGLVAVVAAGNGGPKSHSIGSPAAAANAITVGSMADIGERGFFQSSFSSRGPTFDGRIKPDLSAPGHAITAAKRATTSSYTTKSGTSMATPFVAGVAALMLDANLGLTPGQVKSILEGTAVDWGPVGKDIDFGAGRLDVYAAVNAAAGATLGTGPAVPNRQFLSGSLPGTGTSVFHDINVTNASYPIAMTFIMPTWNAVDFDIYLYNPAGTLVAFSDGVTRQETIAYSPTTTGVYRLEVFSFSGSGGYFNAVSAGASPPDTTPPAAPSGLAVSAPANSNGGTLNLSWNANTEPDVAGYNVYRGTTTGGPYQKVNASLVTTATYSDAGLTNGTTYFYRVAAVDTSGNESAKSAEASGTPVDNKAPTISNVAASPSSTSATVSWNTDENSDSTVEYGTASALGLVASSATMVTSHSIHLTGLSTSTTYFYRVKSKDAAGNLATSATQTFTTTAPLGAIAGKVTDASTSAALSGATVTDGTRTTTTDVNGDYSLANVPAGSYTVTVSRAGYNSASQNVTVTAGATTTANLALTPAPTTGAITGTVTDKETRGPISGATVTNGTQTVSTDANGNYALVNVPAGTYTVTASAPGYDRERDTVTVSAGATAVLHFRLGRD